MRTVKEEEEGIGGFMLKQLIVEVSERSLPQGNDFSKRLRRDSTARFVELTGTLEGALGG